jgi:hypothetical protein
MENGLGIISRINFRRSLPDGRPRCYATGVDFPLNRLPSCRVVLSGLAVTVARGSG